MSNASIYDFVVKDASGADVSLSQYRGRPLLIVNVASKCGFTPQYDGLEKLHQAMGPKGLAVLGFPCNQFGGQEPGGNEEIQTFCRMNYGVTFPVLGKVDVNGAAAAPLFEHLKAEAPGLLGSKFIKWNFAKFLIDKDGKVIERFAPNTPPEALTPAIEALL
ncbi:MAG: glutathione peroxidase [Myxococcales bacterium]|nr:glutathione peroxidase [Myxococcales bacterium]